MGNLSRTLEKYFPSKIFLSQDLERVEMFFGKMMDSEGKNSGLTACIYLVKIKNSTFLAK